MLLTSKQFLRLCKAFENNYSTNIKLSKTRLLGRILEFLGSLLNTGLSLMKIVLKPLAKSILIPLGLTAASAADAAIHKKMFGSSMTTLIISNEEMNDIIKIIKSLEDAGLWIMGVSETIENEVKEQKCGFLGTS